MMNVIQSCPISGESRDEHAVRIVAALVLATAVAATIVRGPVGAIVLALLAADFAVRAFGQPRFSPLAQVATGIARSVWSAPKPVDAAPKRFAAKIGLAFSAIACSLFLFQQPVAATGVLVVLALCAFLESAFGICIGCKVYALLPKRR